MRSKYIILGGFIAVMASTPGIAQVKTSPHDLTTAPGSIDNGEVCVYCHTPHGASESIEAPLWNKPDTGQTYTTYDSTTADGDVLAVGSVSAACLACHDGTQAMDVVINAPGSGAGPGDLGPIGVMAPNVSANIGVDLRNDHPIGVQYGGFDPGTGAKIDPDFKGVGEGLQSMIQLGRTRWWVDTEATPNANRDKTDMILYTRNNGGDQPFVECGSCHDPHRRGSNPNFMRISNAESNVCRACHVK